MNKAQPKILTWTIVDKISNEAIGLQALNKSGNENSTVAEIGIMLSSQANGKLFPEEAMGALMEYAFTQLNIDCINAFYSKKNLATKRFVNKLGFTFNPDIHENESNNHHQYFNSQGWKQSLITAIFPLKLDKSLPY
jgi:RimJ/RimL family protein N-acetyltransferase